jgi:hypothetical protein
MRRPWQEKGKQDGAVANRLEEGDGCTVHRCGIK